MIETSNAVYAQTTQHLSKRLRLIAGVRADAVRFDACGAATMAEILDGVLADVQRFTHGVLRDDIAAFAVKIL